MLTQNVNNLIDFSESDCTLTSMRENQLFFSSDSKLVPKTGKEKFRTEVMEIEKRAEKTEKKITVVDKKKKM